MGKSSEIYTSVASYMQIHLVDRLLGSQNWVCTSVAFQGGTSLQLAYGSPRYSRDLDFLLDRGMSSKIQKAVLAAVQRLSKDMVVAFPGCVVEVTDNTHKGNEMFIFNVKCKHPDLRPKVKVKMEFLQVRHDNIQLYEKRATTLHSRSVGIAANVTPMVPVATPQMIYADKIMALGLRKVFKTRDVFDLWWLRTQVIDPASGRQGLDSPKVWKMHFNSLLSNDLDIYKAGRSVLSDGLHKFLHMDCKELHEAMSLDFDTYLPAHYREGLKSRHTLDFMIGLVSEDVAWVVSEDPGTGGGVTCQ